MGLFLSIYKKQISIILASIAVVGILSILSTAEAFMFMLIAFGAVFTITGIYSIVQHLSTPTTFRSCDVKFFKGLLCLGIGAICIFQFVQTIIK